MHILMFLYCDFSWGTRVLPFTVYFGFAVNLILNSTNFPNQWEPEAWPIIKWWAHAFPCTWQRFQMFQEISNLVPRDSHLPVPSLAQQDRKKRDPGNEVGKSLRGISSNYCRHWLLDTYCLHWCLVIQDEIFTHYYYNNYSDNTNISLKPLFARNCLSCVDVCVKLHAP